MEKRGERGRRKVENEREKTAETERVKKGRDVFPPLLPPCHPDYISTTC